MANTLKIKRGTAATIPQGQLAEPLFTTDTYDLYIGKGSGGNQRFQKYIASGTSSQFLKGDGTLDSTTYQATSEKGQNNGYASLDSGGKVPAAQLPNSIMDYKGTWDASTNTPTLADGTGNAGDVYIVSVGGTQNLGSGSITFAAGDWVVYSGSVWQKSINSNAVASVNGQTGAVVLTTTNISEGTNLYYTDTRARASLSATSPVQYSTSTGVISILDASATQSGVVTTGTQTFEGVKTFNSFLISKQEVVLQKNSVSGGSGYYSLKTNSNVNRWTIGAATVETGSNVGYDFNIYRYDDSGAGLGSVMEIIRSNGNVFFTNNITASSIIKSGGTSSQFLKADGSVDSTSYLPLSGGTLTGNLILPANNTVGGTNYGIQQTMASNDLWKIYGNTVALDQGELVFELQDNAQSWASNGQRFRFYFNPTSGGVAKDVLIMDYDTAVFTTSVTATSIIRSGGTSSQFLKADGSVDSTSYLPLSGGTLTGSLTATAFIPTGSTVPTNGMYLPSANTVAFAANSTRVIQISDSGRVSIGATTPTADTLTVHGAITTTNGGKITAQGMIEAGSTIFGSLNCIIVSDLSAASITPTGSTSPVNGMYLPSANTIAFSTLANPRMRITSGGNVGIGTPSPNSILEVKASGATNSIRLGSIAADATYNGIFLNGSIAEGIALGMAGGGGSDTSLYIQSGNAGSIIFRTGNGTNYSPRMTITSGGNVGIGTTSPNTALDVNGIINVRTNGYEFGRITTNNVTGNIGGLTFQYNSSGTFTPGMVLTGGGNVVIGNTSISNPISFIRVLNISGGDAGLVFSNTNGTAKNWSIGAIDSGSFVFFDGASERMRITSGGDIGFGTSTPNSFANRTYQFHNPNQGATYLKISNTTSGSGNSDGLDIGEINSDAYFINRESGFMQFGTNALERITISSAGQVSIGAYAPANAYTTQIFGSGTASQSYGLKVIAGSSSSDYALNIMDKDDSGVRFRIRGDGLFYMPGIYNNTNVNLANVWVNSDGSMYRSTASSLRYKQNIQDWDGNGLETILSLKPKTFTYKPEHYKNPNLVMLGLIAEEVAEVSTYLAEYENEDRTGLVENVRYANIVVPLIKAIQEQQAQIEELKAKLN